MKHIILLRGLARETAHWLEFPERLQQALGASFRLHFIDFPGCGKYYQQPALRSVAAMTDHARAEIISIVESGEPVFIVGISMGGMVALEWAQRFPQEIQGLVLINSSSGDQPVFWRLQPSALPDILFALLLPCQQREARVLRRVSNLTAEYPQHLQQWLAIQQQRPVTRLTIVRMLRAAALFRPQPTCAVSGIVLASDTDRMVSVRTSEDIAQRFNWPLVRHPLAGHDLPMDDPQWVADEVTRFIYN
jgi:pimeloyl-ACP methyl ester carboxylesterase